MKPPKFLHDLYSDMRDRKLLPLVVVLVLAIIAVPLLLKSDVEAPQPADPAAAAADVPEGIPVPAVLASDPGLRDYRKRLNTLHAKNPFANESAVIDLSESAIQDVSRAAGAAGAGSQSSSASGSGGSTSETVTESSTSTSTDTTVTEDGSGSASGGGGSGHNEVVELAFRVDVEVGPAGATKRRKNVKLLTALPSQSNPVLLFLGASEDGDHAVFLVSEDVVTARGDGRCVPSPADCQFLNMKADDEMKLEYAPSGEPDTFVIRVLDIGLERNSDTAGSGDRDAESEADSPKAGLKSFLGL